MGSPARPGMNLSRWLRHRLATGFPRPRGDEPVGSGSEKVRSTAAPRGGATETRNTVSATVLTDRRSIIPSAKHLPDPPRGDGRTRIDELKEVPSVFRAGGAAHLQVVRGGIVGRSEAHHMSQKRRYHMKSHQAERRRTSHLAPMPEAIRARSVNSNEEAMEPNNTSTWSWPDGGSGTERAQARIATPPAALDSPVLIEVTGKETSGKRYADRLTDGTAPVQQEAASDSLPRHESGALLPLDQQLAVQAATDQPAGPWGSPGPETGAQTVTVPAADDRQIALAVAPRPTPEHDSGALAGSGADGVPTRADALAALASVAGPAWSARNPVEAVLAAATVEIGEQNPELPATVRDMAAGWVCERTVRNAGLGDRVPADPVTLINAGQQLQATPALYEQAVSAAARGEAALRERLARDLAAKRTPEPRIHPHAHIEPGAKVDPEATIGAGAYVAAGAVIGKGAVVGAEATVERGALIAPGARVGPGASVGARSRVYESAILGTDASIGSDSELGPQAVVGDYTRIHDGTMVGCGANIGPDSQLGNGCFVGNDADVGQGCRLDDGASLGERARLGPSASMGPKAYVAPQSVVGRSAGIRGAVETSCVIGDGSVVGEDARIGAGGRIGRSVIVRNGAVTEDHVQVGDRSIVSWCARVGPGATIGDGCNIGDSCSIADAAAIGSGAVLKEHSRVAGGALVAPRASLGPNAEVGEGAAVESGVQIPAGAVVPAWTVAQRQGPGADGTPNVRAPEEHESRLAPSIIDAAADVSPEAEMGRGCIVHQNAVVEAGARIGHGVIIGPGARVESGAVVGDGTVVGDNARLGAGTMTGNGCRIGARADVERGTRTEADSVIGAGTKIGAGTTIAADSVLGDGAAVGAGASLGDTTGIGVFVGNGAGVGAGTRLSGGVAVPAHARIGNAPAPAAGGPRNKDDLPRRGPGQPAGNAGGPSGAKRGQQRDPVPGGYDDAAAPARRGSGNSTARRTRDTGRDAVTR